MNIVELLKKFDHQSDEYFEQFKQLASGLINDFVITKGYQQYLIREIEFYYNNELDHQDLFAQSNEVQLKIGRWLFHTAGVEITFGNGSSFGGILIRGIIKIGDSKMLNGPHKVYEELFQDNGSVDGEDVNLVTIEHSPTLMPLELAYGPRSGLRLISTELNLFEKQKYLFKPYRFIAYEDYMHYTEKYLIGLYQVKVLNKDFDLVADALKLDKSSFSSNCISFDQGLDMDFEEIYSMKQSIEKNCMLFGHLFTAHPDSFPE